MDRLEVLDAKTVEIKFTCLVPSGQLENVSRSIREFVERGVLSVGGEMTTWIQKDHNLVSENGDIHAPSGVVVGRIERIGKDV